MHYLNLMLFLQCLPNSNFCSLSVGIKSDWYGNTTGLFAFLSFGCLHHSSIGQKNVLGISFCLTK